MSRIRDARLVRVKLTFLTTLHANIENENILNELSRRIDILSTQSSKLILTLWSRSRRTSANFRKLKNLE